MKMNIFLGIMMSIVMVACGGGSDSKGIASSQSEQKTIVKGNQTTAIKTISAGDGGSIVFQDGVKLLIPADALLADTEVSITKDAANTSFILRPEGLQANDSVTLQIPVTDKLLSKSGKVVTVYTLDIKKSAKGLGTEQIKVNNLATAFVDDLQSGNTLDIKLNRFSRLKRVVQDPLALSYFMPGKYLGSIGTLTFMSVLNMYEVTDKLDKITEETGKSIQFRVNPIFLFTDTAGTLSGTNLQYGYGAYSDYSAIGITPPSDLSITASGLPDGASFDSNTGVFTWSNIANKHNKTSNPIVFSITANSKTIHRTLTIDIKALVSNETRTVSGTATIPSTQQTISINLTAPKEAYSTTASISGVVTKNEVTTNKYNFAYVIDVSGSMGQPPAGTTWLNNPYGTFSGNETVPDKNVNGHANELLDGAIIAFEALNQDLIKAGFGSANLNIIKFEAKAQSIYSATVGQKNTVNTALEGLRNNGGTNFKDALQKNIDFFQNKGNENNFLFFISDGEHGSQKYGNFDSEVSILHNHNVTIRAIGLGQNASLDDLRIMDSNAQRVLEPSTLTAGLSAPGVNNIDRVEIYVNQALIKTIPEKDLDKTAVGSKYKVGLTTLVAGQDDEVEARVIADDNDATSASAKLTITE